MDGGEPFVGVLSSLVQRFDGPRTKSDAFRVGKRTPCDPPSVRFCVERGLKSKTSGMLCPANPYG